MLPKAEEKELFRTFCEDYNTATLPHRKYCPQTSQGLAAALSLTLRGRRLCRSVKPGLCEVMCGLACH